MEGRRRKKEERHRHTERVRELEKGVIHKPCEREEKASCL